MDLQAFSTVELSCLILLEIPSDITFWSEML